jgi:hypothetical protein
VDSSSSFDQNSPFLQQNRVEEPLYTEREEMVDLVKMLKQNKPTVNIESK